MKKQIEKYIPEAVDAVAETLIPKNKFEAGRSEEVDTSPEKAKKVPREYKGYISALGASLIQSGLLPTLAFYSRNSETANTVEDRSLVLKAILYILKAHNKVGNSTNLFSYACELQTKGNVEQLNILHQDITDAAIALKLAIRTFEFTKS